MTTRFVYDTAEGMPLILTDGAAYYLYGPDGVPFEQVTAAGVVTYLHADQLGSIRLITSSTGKSLGTATYTAYGTRTTTGTTSPFGYAGAVHRHRDRPAMAPGPLLRPHHRPVPHRRPPRRRHRRSVRLRGRQPHHRRRPQRTLRLGQCRRLPPRWCALVGGDTYDWSVRDWRCRIRGLRLGHSVRRDFRW